MNKIMTFIFFIGLVLLSGKSFAQETTKQKDENDRKGGFAVGGFDNARKSKDATRGVESLEVMDRSLEVQSVPPVTEKAAKEEVKKDTIDKKEIRKKAGNSKNNPEKVRGWQLQSDTTNNKDRSGNKTRSGRR